MQIRDHTYLEKDDHIQKYLQSNWPSCQVWRSQNDWGLLEAQSQSRFVGVLPPKSQAQYLFIGFGIIQSRTQIAKLGVFPIPFLASE